MGQSATYSLVLPGLQQALQSCAAEPSLFRQLPALRQFFRFASQASGPESVTAALSLLFNGAWDLNQPRSVEVIAARPVNLQADRDHLLLSTPPVSLAQAELDLVAQQLATHFQDIFEQVIVENDYLLLLLHAPAVLQCHLHVDAIGKNIDNYLPRGDQATHWNALMNEMQMLLYPLNLPFNALWLESVPGKNVKQTDTTLWSTDALLATDCPLSLSQISQQLEQQAVSCMVFSAQLLHADVSLISCLHELEVCFAAMLKQLKAGSVDCLQLIEGDGRQLHLQRFDLWKFWRKERPKSQIS